MLHALCVVQTVSLHKLASAMPNSRDRDTNLRRIQRFLAKFALDLDVVAKIIFSLLPEKTGLVLSMDRTYGTADEEVSNHVPESRMCGFVIKCLFIIEDFLKS